MTTQDPQESERDPLEGADEARAAEHDTEQRYAEVGKRGGPSAIGGQVSEAGGASLNQETSEGGADAHS